MDGEKARLAMGYSRTSALYDLLAGHGYLAAIRRLLPLVRVRHRPAILDVGCGTGLNLFEAARWFAPTGPLVGIDLSPGMVAVAAAKARQLGIPATILLGDAERLPLPDASFDLVLCNSVFHWFRDRPAAMREMARVLKPGGQLALITATAPGFREWFLLIDAVIRVVLGPDRAPPIPELPTAEEVAALMQAAGLAVERLQNRIQRDLIVQPLPFVQLMSVIAPTWPGDLSDAEVARVQQAAAQLMAVAWPQGFPFTWSAVEALATKIV
ncbi:class I SAM-dependent methyltransferase [Symbiobacterium thermophilum]|uniref:Conserved domain protein n=2 Tax=Symbiobacterium thermophilum TaxID=2734 RepID=Q67LB5_SYMTH|nr:class I SAM-dependent methyltransferase [Symbiobacterium thermophilum]MBY6274848.1 class I SAM-dependent methyltransferase [Symbiobacterium thermophilum]BAD41531.1 conserved domain protein [Symbiobacterium thermophilum IAM 14863]